MEKNPWWKNVDGPFPSFQGPVGVKEDGGGSIRGCGRVGPMAIHHAVCNRDAAEVGRLVEAGHLINEVEAAGNTPLHNAAYEGWVEGAELLLSLGARVNASNNAGDTPWHWAQNMGHQDMMTLLEKDFYSKECWAHHPKPYADFMEAKRKEYEAMEAQRRKAIGV